jgi:hypothetical protein
VTVNAPAAGKVGSSMTISWSSTNATACSTNFSGSGVSGSLGYVPTVAGAQTFTVTCSGTGGTGAGSASSTVAAGTKSVVAKWSVPTTRADGSALAIADLAGYEVYFSDTAGLVNGTLPVTGGSVASVIVPNLTTGTTYYFTISAVDTAGNKSALSSVVTVAL